MGRNQKKTGSGIKRNSHGVGCDFFFLKRLREACGSKCKQIKKEERARRKKIIFKKIYYSILFIEPSWSPYYFIFSIHFLRMHPVISPPSKTYKNFLSFAPINKAQCFLSPHHISCRASVIGGNTHLLNFYIFFSLSFIFPTYEKENQLGGGEGESARRRCEKQKGLQRKVVGGVLIQILSFFFFFLF